MSQIRAVVFDCFGVLLADVLRTKADQIEHTNPEAAQRLFAAMRAGDRGIISQEEVAAQVGDVLGMSAEEVLHMAQAGEVKNEVLMSEIKKLRPRYKVGLLSNINGRAWLDERFGEGVLDDLFDTVVASGDVGMIKPEPGIFELVLERLGVEAHEAVMIDDLERYCEGARAVGMQAIQFHTTKQALDELNALLVKE